MKTHYTTCLLIMFALSPFYAVADDVSVPVQVSDVSHTIVQVALSDKMTPEDAANAMIRKASELNLRYVGRQKIYRQLRKQGKYSPHLEIFQFCDLEAAGDLVVQAPLFAAYMPCRIAMVEDSNKQIWLMTLNLDMVIDQRMLSPSLAEVAIRINQNIMKVLVAGATGID